MRIRSPHVPSQPEPGAATFARVGGTEAAGARIRARLRARIPALLGERPFRRYWSAQTISMFGDQVSAIALPLTGVLVLHASAAQMGYLTAIEWLPSLLFALHAGAWVDRRGHRRATMIVADIGRALLLLSVLDQAPAHAARGAAGQHGVAGPGAVMNAARSNDSGTRLPCGHAGRRRPGDQPMCG